MITRGQIQSASLSAITTGGTAQNVFAANEGRSYLFFQNTSDTDMWVAFGKTAAVESGRCIPAGSYGGFEFQTGLIPTQWVSVYCATTGKTFTAEQG